MNRIQSFTHEFFQNIRQYIRWLFFGAMTGIIVGLFCTVFSFCLEYAARYRMEHSFVILLLPLGGVVIVFLYKLLHYEENTGTNSVLDSIHSEIQVALRMAFLIFSSTVITIFCGGSVGREGAALQIGSSIGSKLGSIFRFNDKDKKIILMSGMSAAFAALFGTPMAAAIFSMEVASVGIMYYAALVPCICAALVAQQITILLKAPTENFHTPEHIPLELMTGVKIIFLAILCAAISIIFCKLLHYCHSLFAKIFVNTYWRIVAGGLILILLTVLVQSTDYLGTGMFVIERALHGTALPYAFLLKMLFTVITISAGYKGGEIVPSLFIGATLGCALSPVIGLSPVLGASAGMIAMFCGVTNCPITSLLISFELFGFDCSYYFLIAVATSYMLSGYCSLYHTQTIVYSKFENTYINRSTGDH